MLFHNTLIDLVDKPNRYSTCVNPVARIFEIFSDNILP